MANLKWQICYLLCCQCNLLWLWDIVMIFRMFERYVLYLAIALFHHVSKENDIQITTEKDHVLQFPIWHIENESSLLALADKLQKLTYERYIMRIIYHTCSVFTGNNICSVQVYWKIIYRNFCSEMKFWLHLKHCIFFIWQVKRANRLIMSAKCHAIRDAQIAEKKQIAKDTEDEEHRLDQMMEKDRRRALRVWNKTIQDYLISC